MMTDASDPGLTDLLAAHTRLGAQQVGRYLCLCGWVGDYHDHPAHVALVVEQHTNGRMAELRDVKAERNELKAIVVRVRAVTEDLVQNIADDEKTLRSPNVSVGEAQELPAVINVQKIYLKDLRAALEGEQQ